MIILLNTQLGTEESKVPPDEDTKGKQIQSTVKPTFHLF